MKFMCLVLIDSEMAKTIDWEEIGSESFDYDVKLFRDQVYVRAEALESVSSARTVRVRNGEAMVTDGPFMETREQVAGFILVEASDMEHALEIAKGIPLARYGAVEVRPVLNPSPE
ncbi:YciI family protein [Pelagibacterium luteolum]|uniref:Uncharacterized conserved protein n=1 Tax=Pelagibacterium luteolum TaxID=440168 RepID=A0A1G7YAP9_9HYPH|nr:YciI family protein [Pelagibacterium luteolum]SDG93409.1 Uncharacterized conserved protein [Pelagibacterium luteolum]